MEKEGNTKGKYKVIGRGGRVVEEEKWEGNRKKRRG